MNLDDLDFIRQTDTQNYLAEIDDLPAQLSVAWKLGQTLPLFPGEGIERVLIAGMGGSAIGADLLGAYAEPFCPLPFSVHRDYGLPAWARGPQTLVIVSSHSGNTEEALSAFEAAVASGCRILAITTGGQLAKAAQSAGATVWAYEHKGQPRAAVGYSFALQLAAFSRLGLIPDPSEELDGAVEAMRAQQARLKVTVPAVHNFAKRCGGQLVGRWVTVVGAEILAPVARRWKGQINELAKAWAQFEFLPEADHNTVAGVGNPEEALARTLVLFLRAPTYSPRNRLRTDLTKKVLMLQGLNTDFVDARGKTRLANLWTALHFGDYAAFYLAMAYGVDPSPIPAIQNLKKEMEAVG